jgi:DNA processing protein
LERFGSAEAVFDAVHATSAGQFFKPAVLGYLRNPDWAAIGADLAWCAANPRHHIITLGDASYPGLLRQIADPPPVLFVHGAPEALNQPQLAMVGSRNPTPQGEQNAFEFALALAQTGLTITSGMALGVDAQCHRGALAAGGLTIAVTGTGLDRVYPKSHHDLAHQIAEQGALVSEFAIGTPALKENFPRRNRIISGLSLGTLVVEASIGSGSLITAREALEQGREVLAIPGSIHNPLARGCHALIRQGAKLVETAQDVLEEIRFESPETTASSPTGKSRTTKAEPREDARAVLDSLGHEPASIDTIVHRTGLTADQVSSILLMLELSAQVRSSGAHYFRVHR